MDMFPVPPDRHLARAFGALSLIAVLAACGGGSGSPAPSTAVSADAAKTASANAASVPTDSAAAVSTVVATAEAVVAAGSASVTITCPGGGTAMYQVTGPNAALLGNHQFDEGEVYTLTFNACKSATGAASVTGVHMLTVTAKTADSITLDTATNNVVVSLPLREITLNGSSTVTRTIATSGPTTTITTHWVTPNFSVSSRRNLRTSTFSYTNVDITRSVVLTNGVVTGTSYNGTSTLSWVWPNGSYQITFATQGTVNCDADGTPTQGIWTITLPNNRIVLTIVPGVVTVQVDFGNDGTIDRTYVFTVTDLMGEAG